MSALSSPLSTIGNSPLNAKAIVESLFSEIQWESQDKALVACPGRHLHSTSDGKKDCAVYLNGVPTVSCFHGSCSQATQEAQNQLRKLLADQTGSLRSLNKAQQLAVNQAQKNKAGKRRLAAHSRDRILRSFQSAVSDLKASSPVEIPDYPLDHWPLLLRCFEPNDLIWCAETVWLSGPDHAAATFRTREEWLERTVVPGNFICPSTFKPGSVNRSNEQVALRRFLVVESDTLTKSEVCGVFRWMQEKVGMNLRAVVDTGGKSLHGWFDVPPKEEMDDLELVLPAFGCDPKMFNLSQPARLPGAFRDTGYQTLVYLGEEGVCQK